MNKYTTSIIAVAGGDMIVALDQVVRVELVRVGKQTTQAQKPTLSKIKYLVFLTSFATTLMFTEI